MSDAISRVQAELAELGYETSVRDSGQGTVVEFDYQVETGSREGETFRVGVSFQETNYPEYPPHWIHVSPPVDDGRGGLQRYTTADGQEWAAMSRSPSDIWDRLPVKDMKNYMNEHVRRFWGHI